MAYVFNPFTGNLDTTDVVAFNGEVNAGTEGSPSLFFTGDTDTGIYSPGANQLALGTGGTGRLFVNANGDVGVGVTNPSAQFDVSAGTNLNLSIDQIAHNNYTNVGIGTTFCRTSDDSDVMAIGVVDTDKLGFFSRFGLIFGTGGASYYDLTTEAVRIHNNGTLLVGATSTSGDALLQVNGDKIRIATSKTPASAGAAGTAGEVCWDANYIYVCTATNTWARAAITGGF
jgi:hypothetical protein